MALDINIRPCHADEYGSILDLWRDAGSTPSVSDTIDALKKMLQEADDLLLVAEYNGQIIGTVMGGWDGWRGNIYRLAVFPEYRRQGIGQALVREIEGKLVLKGAKKISILVEKEEDSAVAFWDSMMDTYYNKDDRFIRYVKYL